MYDLMKNTILG